MPRPPGPGHAAQTASAHRSTGTSRSQRTTASACGLGGSASGRRRSPGLPLRRNHYASGAALEPVSETVHGSTDGPGSKFPRRWTAAKGLLHRRHEAHERTVVVARADRHPASPRRRPRPPAAGPQADRRGHPLDSPYDCDALRAWFQKEYGVELIAPNRRNRHKTQDGRPLRRYRRRWKVERIFVRARATPS